MHVLRCVAAVLVAGAAALGCSTPAVSCDCPASPPRGCVFTGRTGCACAAMVCSDVGPLLDIPVADVETRDARRDTTTATDSRVDVGVVDAATDAPVVIDGVPFDGGTFDGGTFDGGTFDGGTFDAPFVTDRGTTADAPLDGGSVTGVDAARDTGSTDVPVPRPDAVVIGPDVPPLDAGMPSTCEPGLVMPPPRVCATSADCVTGIFALDCCGTMRAIAYNGTSPSSAALFNMLRMTCDLAVGPASGRICGCPSRGIVLDNGSTVPLGTLVGSACLGGVCTTVGP